MITKIKISDVAKDFDVKATEIINVLAKYYEGKKTRTSVLEQDELNLIFEYYTKQYSVDNLDAYFELVSPEGSKKEKETEAPSEPAPEKEEKKEEKASKTKKAEKAPKEEEKNITISFDEYQRLQVENVKLKDSLQDAIQRMRAMNDALPEAKVTGKVALSEKKLNKYFPSHMSSREREKIILDLLAKWKEEQEEA